MKTVLYLVCLLPIILHAALPASCALLTVSCEEGKAVDITATGDDAETCCQAKEKCLVFSDLADYCVNGTVKAETYCQGLQCTIADVETCCGAATTEAPGATEAPDDVDSSEARTSLIVTLTLFAILWIAGICFFGYHCRSPPQRMYTDKEREAAKSGSKKKKDEELGSEEESSS